MLTAGVSGCLTRAMLYPVPQYPVPNPPAPFEEIELPVEGGRALLWTPHLSARTGGPARTQGKASAARAATRPPLLFFHGNGENLGILAASGLLAELGQFGSVSAIDYPGYGRGAGSPSEQGNKEAGLAALKLVHERSGQPVVVVGWSLGAAVAAATVAGAQPGQVKAVILLSPWASLDSVARRHFPGWLVWLVLSEEYDSVAAARSIKVPALIVHGANDGLIPVSEGSAVALALPGARLRIIAGAGHNDLFSRPATFGEMRSFLAELR